jgi:hypothetical protein
LLSNDFDIDGNEMKAVLSFGNGTSNGSLYLHPDGSFYYSPDPGFKGEDFFMYYLDDDRAFSSLVPVYLKVGYPLSSDVAFTQGLSSVFPNPGEGRFCIKVSQSFQKAYLYVYDIMGREISDMELMDATTWVGLEHLSPGIYLFNLRIDEKVEQHQVIIY